ncbi:DEAD-box ATP-dependent RNA helicase 50-like [Tripterygium wilfordii]|uniref:DEAD-box ATP-dependent RNA helicase 50-like n=1 Tax=Tripterygium wilfordii TaxID=458696 RepID=A0A7J7CS60_TRIWF|nr:DEAD-box ATP-dependent RNA helicase 50 [Tripterygium wilfordii]KAF5736838.1 DEAD-box ATP-dependent RNA helicase 50-like [Tripterygium wilfordii]
MLAKAPPPPPPNCPRLKLLLPRSLNTSVQFTRGCGSFVLARAGAGKTQDHTAIEDIDYTIAVTGDVPTAQSIRDLTGGFEKLKVQRVKAIMNKTSRIRREITQHKQEIDEVDSDDDVGGIDGESEYQVMPNKRNDFRSGSYRQKGEASKGSAGSLRGWGNGGSARNSKYVRNSKYEPTDGLKYQSKVSGQTDFYSRRSFGDLGCTDFMIDSLKAQRFLRPAHVQAMAFGPVSEGKSCIIADQSGSGKTLAYLIPVLQRLRQEELQGLSKSSSQSPRAVVIVPTAELASQVLNNCRSMSKCGVPFRSMVATGGFQQKTQLENLEQGVDVLIATPGRFMFLINEGFLQLTNLKCAVLDEVDILFKDEVFETALQCLMNSSPVATQYLFVTATLPVDIYNKLVEVFPDCEVIMGPGMHRISPRLEEILVDCSGDAMAAKTPETAFHNKKSALLQLVQQNPVPKTIVFCNKIETCRKVENALKRCDRKGTSMQVLPFHAALAQESRIGNLKEFTKSLSGEESLFLVCTDRASRGIDFAGVDHVVLFDFPREPSEYVRRVGRTARGAGGSGKAFIFVVGKQVSLAQKIIDRNQKGHPLHDVPSAYELMN